jgi:hypothetical protein
MREDAVLSHSLVFLLFLFLSIRPLGLDFVEMMSAAGHGQSIHFMAHLDLHVVHQEQFPRADGELMGQTANHLGLFHDLFGQLPGAWHQFFMRQDFVDQTPVQAGFGIYAIDGKHHVAAALHSGHSLDDQGLSVTRYSGIPKMIVPQHKAGIAEGNIAHHGAFPVEAGAVDDGDGGYIDIPDKVFHDLGSIMV